MFVKYRAFSIVLLLELCCRTNTYWCCTSVLIVCEMIISLYQFCKPSESKKASASLSLNVAKALKSLKCNCNMPSTRQINYSYRTALMVRGACFTSARIIAVVNKYVFVSNISSTGVTKCT